MVEMPDYTLEGEKGPVRLAEIFDGRSQLIVYNHMWFPGEEWQCPGCTGFTAQFTRLGILDNFDARFVIVTQGPIDEALAYKRRVGNTMTWYSTANSPFGTDVGAPPGGGFACERLPPRRRHRVPHLAHRRPGHRAARVHLRAHRPAPVRAAGGVAGLARGLAAVAHLQQVGGLRGHRRALRRHMMPRATVPFEAAWVRRISHRRSVRHWHFSARQDLSGPRAPSPFPPDRSLEAARPLHRSGRHPLPSRAAVRGEAGTVVATAIGIQQCPAKESDVPSIHTPTDRLRRRAMQLSQVQAPPPRIAMPLSAS